MALWDKVAGEWGMRTEPEVATSLDPNDGLVDTGRTTSDGEKIFRGERTGTYHLGLGRIMTLNEVQMYF